MGFRVSIRHVQQAGSKTGGWGENFWNSSNDLTDVITKATALRDVLDVCKGVPCILPSARISPPDPPRTVKQVEFPGTSLGTVAEYGSANYPNNALLLRLTAPGGYESDQWLSGIPDEIIYEGGKYLPGNLPKFITRINAFLAVLTSSGNGWSLRGLNRNILKVPITGVNLTTGIVTCPNHGLGGAGAIAKTRISGFKVPAGINDVWRVTVIDANSFQLNFYTPPVAPITAFGINPTSRKQEFVYVAIQTANIVRATAHYRGRPTELLGGARRNRRTRRGGQPVDV